MTYLSGIVAALAVILFGLGFFAAVALGRKRAIEAGGYVEIESAGEAIDRLTRTLFELPPAEVHRRDDPSGQSWLVFVEAGSSEDSGCAMIVYPLAQDGWPAVAAIRSGRRIPGIFRWLTGGLFKWAEPLAEAEATGFAGTGWFVYKEANKGLPEALKERLCKAVRGPCARGLLGIAVIGSRLAVWSDAARLKPLLANAPLVRAAFLKQPRHA